MPSGIVNNDILILVIVNNGSASTPDGSWTLEYSGIVADVGLQVYWKRTTGTEPTLTITCSGFRHLARVLAYSGCKSTGSPFDAGVATGTGYSEVDGTITVAGDTTTSADTLALIFTGHFAQGGSSRDGDPPPIVTTPTWTNADFANLAYQSNSTNLFTSLFTFYNIGFSLWTGEKATAAAFGNTVSSYYWNDVISLSGRAQIMSLIGEAPASTYSIDIEPMAVSIGLLDLSFSAAGSAGSLDMDPMAVTITMQPIAMTHGGGGVSQIDTWQWDTPEVENDFAPINWYVAHQYSDGGAEAQSKQIKAVRITGKTTRGEIQIHGTSPGDVVSRENVEGGVNSRASFEIRDVNDVTRHERVKMRVRNMSLALVRVSGTWDGAGTRDRLDEIAVEGETTGTTK